MEWKWPMGPFRIKGNPLWKNGKVIKIKGPSAKFLVLEMPPVPLVALTESENPILPRGSPQKRFSPPGFKPQRKEILPTFR